MAFIPHYQAQFIGPLVENLLAIIERDEAEALLWANNGVALPGFSQRDWSRRVDVEYPFLAVMASRTEALEGEEQGYIKQVHTIVVEIQLIDSDPNTLTRNLYTYVKAVDAIIHSANPADMVEGLSQSDASLIGWDVTEHNYTLTRASAEHRYLQIAQMKVVVQVWEQ